MTTPSDLIFPIINGTITPSNALAPVLAHRFDTPAWKQGIVASDPFPNEATKEYLAIADYTKWRRKLPSAIGLPTPLHRYIVETHKAGSQGLRAL